MAFEVMVPRLGWSMESGVFGEWLKQDGDAVTAGEPVFTIEGEKAIEEVESEDAGVLHIRPGVAEPGVELTVGTVIGWLLAEGEAGSRGSPRSGRQGGRRAGPEAGRGGARSDTRRRRGDGRGSPRRAVGQPDRLQSQGPTSRAGTRRRLAAGLRIRQGGSYPRARRPRAGGTP